METDNKSNKDKKTVIEIAETNIKYHSEEIEKWKKIKQTIKDIDINSTQLSFLPPPPKIERKEAKKDRIVLGEKAVDILKQTGFPLTSKDLMEAIQKVFPDKVWENVTKFAGTFSNQYKKHNIMQYKVKDSTREVRLLYGLSDWFDESGDLKNEYKMKAKERYQVV